MPGAGAAPISSKCRTEAFPNRLPRRRVVTPVLGGRFVRVDYTWGYRGTPQEGSLLLGYDAKANTVTGHWIDTWHMSDKIMSLLGPQPADSVLSLRGTYAAPPGPDWGWRIDVTPQGTTGLRLVMFNVWPEGGREDPAVEAVYSRA